MQPIPYGTMRDGIIGLNNFQVSYLSISSNMNFWIFEFCVTYFSACSGKRQSPINIDVYDAKVESAVQDLKFARYIKTHRLSFSKIDMYFLINPNFGNTFIFHFLLDHIVVEMSNKRKINIADIKNVKIIIY